MSKWNWSAERRTAIGDVANQSLECVVERLLESRKRAFDAESRTEQLQTELDALKAAHAWIKTSERMPDGPCDVLGVVKGASMLLRYAPDDDPDHPWLDEQIGCYPTSYVAHWQLLPEPPK